MLRKNDEWSVTCSQLGRPGKRGTKLERERMKRETAGEREEARKNRGEKA